MPRWTGDSNFMTAVANTRTLPEAISDSAAKIRAAWDLGGVTDEAAAPATTAPRRAARRPHAAGYVGPYRFPDNSRRRIPGACIWSSRLRAFVIWVTVARRRSVRQRWLAVGGAAAAVVAAISITSGWRMHVDEKEAWIAAQQAVGFPVGHASAQQVWRGLRSRPTWRVLCYSIEDPPDRRGLVLVDAIDGRVVEHLVEANPDAS